VNFIEELAAKRQLLLDGLKANGGDINLGIFEDFYPDEAHFIYELLQNAEDAGATEVSFELYPESCAFIHNGPRHFDESDIRAITGIFNSTKKDNPDKIGKFGVGFKSVFVYTDTPVVYSKNYSFKISQLVLPELVPENSTLGECTRFEFPFNNNKKNPQQSFAEVKAGLEQISDTTLLFLNNLWSIKWSIGGQQGTVIRDEHSDVHIEIIKSAKNGPALSSHWLRFSVPVDGLEVQKVSVAYELEFLGDLKIFDIEKPLSKQLKIVPAEHGQVAVFFPAEKETSGLRFHLHAPFIPELSRASIKNSPDNLPLFGQLASLVAHSLHGIKNLGLLTGEFLAVLPNGNDPLPERYKVIRQAIVREMREEPLTPTQNRGHAPAKSLLQGRASLKKLLSTKDLELILARDDSPTWVIGVMNYSNQGYFLASLNIKTWEVMDLVRLLTACDSDFRYAWGREDYTVIQWLATKSDEWHQQLYAILYRFLVDDECDFLEQLKYSEIIRLADGTYGNAQSAFFPSASDASDVFARVSDSILSSGKNRNQQADAWSFLSELGVREVGEAEEIAQILGQRYSQKSEVPPDDIYLADLKRFIDFVENKPRDLEMFRSSYIFKVDASDFGRCDASMVYIDYPFRSTGLQFYYLGLPENKRTKWPLSNWYEKNSATLSLSNLSAFAETIGCSATFSEFIIETTCRKNPEWSYLYKVAGERNTSPFDLDYSTSGEIYELLKSKNKQFSHLVWRTMNSLNPVYLKARYQRNAANGSRFANSAIIYILSMAEWVPLRDGRFVTPSNASRDELLPGFSFDSASKWLELVNFGEDQKNKIAEYTIQTKQRAELAQKRAELGFETDEALERAQAFAKLPQDEQVRVLEEHRARSTGPEEEFPIRPLRNKTLRTRRIIDQAIQTPGKETQMRTRSVSVGYDSAKTEAKLYLHEQYTNGNGIMFCQVCKAPLPFRLPSGSYYFEAVELVDGMPKRFRETFLALCPNHAAMFQYANEQKLSMQNLLEVAVGLEVEVTLGGEPATIIFTETHIADIKACLESSEISEKSA
jgi:hypothetical protein